MAEREIRATHEEVEGFAAKLRDFHRSPSDPERAMLETVLEGGRPGRETGGYSIKLSSATASPTSGSRRSGATPSASCGSVAKARG